MCILFSSCETTSSCQHCVSENPSCYSRCESQYVGVLDSNVINAVSDVASETVCWELCHGETGCRFYSYFSSRSPVFPQICFLLSHESPPYQHSEHCLTGPLTCQGNFTSVCSLSVGGETSQSILLNDTTTDHTVQLIGDGECEVRILAVGGGGYGGSYGGEGGGSGYLSYLSQPLQPFTQLTVTVGQSDEVT